MRLLILIQFMLLSSNINAQPAIHRYRDPVSNKWGFRNDKGQIIVPATFHDIAPLKSGKYIVLKEIFAQALFDEQAKQLCPFEYTLIKIADSNTVAVKQKGAWKILDRDLREVQHFRFSEFVPEQYYNIVSNEANLFGILDHDWRQLVPFVYTAIYRNRFNPGQLVATKKGKSGVIDTSNEMIVPFTHEYINVLNEQYYLAINKDKVTLLDTSGAVYLKGVYIDLKYNEDGTFTARNAQGFYGIVDKMNNIILPFNYKLVLYHPSGTYIAQDAQFKWGAIDKNAKVLIPFAYKEAWPFRDNIARFKNNSNKYAYINTAGIAITPFKYDEAGDFIFGKAVFNIYSTGKGIVDEHGQEVVAPQALHLKVIHENYYLARKNRSSFIRRFGDSSPQDTLYSVSGTWELMLINDDEPIRAMKNNKYGFINRKGIIMIPFNYDRAGNFIDGYATVIKEGKMMAIDRKGRELHL